MKLEQPEKKLCIQEQKNSNINSDQIYFLAKGKCEVIVTDRFNNRIANKVVKRLKMGDSFGEIAMLFESK